MTSDTVSITFPDLSAAEASILAQELAAALAEDGVPAGNITRQRGSTDAQDMGAIVLVAAGAYLFDLAKDAGREFVKGAANRAGQRAMDAILRKWGTRARIEGAGKPTVILGEQHKRIAPPRSIEQAQTLSDLKSLGVVLLGASTFPNYSAEKKLDNPAFKRSAELARQLFSPAHTVFREAHVLDLFDQDLRPDDIVDRIEDHVTRHPDMRDVVLYYCGHGDFLPDRDRTYYLALKGTRPGRESATGLGLKSFRLMIEQQGTLINKRCTFFLDCCFAGAAVDAFQLSGLDPMIEAQVRDLPSRGFALLTAADRNLPAMGRDGQGATMFTGALAEVLTGRGTPGGKQLSLGDLCAETARHIKQKHGFDGVVPQCHAPGQSDGDVSRVPMFVIGAAPPLSATGSGLGTGAEVPQAGAGFFGRLFGGSTQPASDVAVAAAEWKRVQQSTDPSLLRSFARQFPGYYGELATARAVELEQAAASAARARIEAERQTRADRTRRQDAAWDAAQQSASVADFERFLADFADSPHAVEVRQHLPALREHERQAQIAWDDVKASTSARELEQFSRHFPGRFAALARERIEHLKAGTTMKPGQVVRDLDIGPELLGVPPGRFRMGESGANREVTIGYPLLVGKYPITFAEWDAAQAHRDWQKHSGIAPRKPNDHGWGRGKRPVIDVNWEDAKAFSTWLAKVTGKDYRLLSEAEWEYCCRAGTTTNYSFGDQITMAQAQFSEGEMASTKQTLEVGKFPATAFGLYDMHGNVWERCEDTWHDGYEGAPTDGSVWQGGDASRRVVRGGSWIDRPEDLRSAARDWLTTESRYGSSGFRVVRPLVPPRTL